MTKSTAYSYDIDDPHDRSIIMDLPFSELNKRGRRAKKKHLKAYLASYGTKL